MTWRLNNYTNFLGQVPTEVREHMAQRLSHGLLDVVLGSLSNKKPQILPMDEMGRCSV